MTGKRMYETFYIPVGSLIPVFIYLYVLVFIEPDKKITKKLKLLFIPFFVFLFSIAIPYKIEALLSTVAEHYGMYKLLNGFQSGFSLLYTLTLILASYFTVRRYEQKPNLKTNSAFSEFNWLKNTLIILFVLSCFWGYALVKFFSTVDYQVYFRLLWVGLSITIYWLCLLYTSPSPRD